jgi:hypothetical protein
MATNSSTCLQATSSLSQGMQFAKLTSAFHGGSRKLRRNNRKRKMVRTRRQRQKGGGSFFTPFSEYSTAFDVGLPKDLLESARIAPLDAKFAELPAIQRAAGVPMSGGGRRRNGRKTRRHRGGVSALNAPSMLLSGPEEEAAARLNPQWYTENTVIPNFRAPIPIPGGTVPAPPPPPPPAPTTPPKTGGRRARKSRKYKMMRS